MRIFGGAAVPHGPETAFAGAFEDWDALEHAGVVGVFGAGGSWITARDFRRQIKMAMRVGQ